MTPLLLVCVLGTMVLALVLDVAALIGWLRARITRPQNWSKHK
jgi:uncharacterized membrane protein